MGDSKDTIESNYKFPRCSRSCNIQDPFNMNVGNYCKKLRLVKQTAEEVGWQRERYIPQGRPPNLKICSLDYQIERDSEQGPETTTIKFRFRRNKQAYNNTCTLKVMTGGAIGKFVQGHLEKLLLEVGAVKT